MAMKTAFLIVSHFLYHVICINTSRSTDCISHMDSCISPRLCRSEHGLLKNICVFKDGSCQMTNAKVCNSTLQIILTQSPAYGGCFCTALDPCSNLQLLYSQCLNYMGSIENQILNSPAKSGVTAEPQTIKGKMQTQANKEVEAEWQASGLSGYVRRTTRSCLQEMMQCIQNEVCNRQMVPFVQTCSAHQCNPSQCKQAVRQFYSGLPHNVAEALVFCDCDKEDQECQEIKTSLHSVSCLNDQPQTPWTCLEMLDSCSGDALCRQTFNRYLTECFGAEEAPYGEHSTSDWLQLLDPDFFLEEGHSCRIAFVATMGSILHHPCTCEGLYHHDLQKCSELQHIFQNKSLFKVSRTKGHFQQEPTQINESSIERQWLSDQLLYLLIYISVLMAVVLFVITLVVHRLRKIHQAAGRPSFEAHQSKSLMLSSDNV